jgi:uncharacterized membrane protein required for colicin V production
MDRIGTPELIDICIVAAILVLALVGSWRGAVKEVFVSASLLLGVLVGDYWTAEWSDRLSGWFDLSSDTSQLIFQVAIPVVAIVFIGYVASVNAGVPPADAPGRAGGFVVGAMNGIILLSIVSSGMYDHFLSTRERDDLAASWVGSALVFDFDLVALAIGAVALLLSFASVMIRRRRAAILGPGRAQIAGASGFHVRRDGPLAPEAEKLESTTWPAGAASPIGETVPLARVVDPSRTSDRVPATPAWNVATEEDVAAARAEVVRCISCGERLSTEDRFCPRCGRSLIR